MTTVEYEGMVFLFHKDRYSCVVAADSLYAVGKWESIASSTFSAKTEIGITRLFKQAQKGNCWWGGKDAMITKGGAVRYYLKKL